MELIEMDSLFPEEPSRSSQSVDKSSSQGPTDSPSEHEMMKRNILTTNAMYNLLLQKGLFTREEFHEMKNTLNLLMYPEDFS